ncbi:hypothetical protein ABTL60_19110, partial [Acinetobacter baumannii]
RPGVPPIAAFALWFIARYAAAVDPAAASRGLAHGARITETLDADLWPECELRDEALRVLGIDDLSAVLAATPVADHVEAVADAITWLRARPSGE